MFDPLPLIFYIRYLPDLTRGAPPTCSIWFHIGLLHTVVDKRLGILRVMNAGTVHQILDLVGNLTL